MLGFIVPGPISIPNSIVRSDTQCNLNITDNLDIQLRKFWKLEEIPKTKHFSDEELACEKHYQETTTLDKTGRFIVLLPLKDFTSKLGESRTSATKRFISLENKFKRNRQYKKFIHEYISLGHMSLVQNPIGNFGYFLPHYAVLKGSSSTTKLRVVFDASAKSDSNTSLNDILMVGLTIQDDLIAIVLRFRKHNIVLSADIAKMYRQVIVKEDERHSQQVIWRSNFEDPLSVYKLNTVTSGTSSVPFLAIRPLHEIAHRHSVEFKKASDIILHDFYVDDLLTGASTIDEINKIKQDVSFLLGKYGFVLRKWQFNQPLEVPTTTSIEQLLIADDQSSRTLGLIWNPRVDTLQYDISLMTVPK